MPSLALGDAKFAFAALFGLGLVVLARWASRTRGSKRDTWVALRIGAGGYGQITIRDAMGYPLSAGATADTDIPTGTPVRVIGTKGLELVVAPRPPATPTESGET